MTAKRILAGVAVVLIAAVISIIWWADVENKSEADVNALVQQHAESIAGIVGTPLINPATTSSGCKGKLGETSDSIYSVQGSYNLDQPEGRKHLDTIARVRADWQAKGYTITDDRETGTDDGIVQSRTPDGFTILLTRTGGTGFAVIIHSPCFERP